MNNQRYDLRKIFEMVRGNLITPDDGYKFIKGKSFPDNSVVVTDGLHDAGSDSPSVIGLLEKDVREKASEILKISPDRLDMNENMGAYGFDSITMKEFGESLCRTYAIEISPTVFFSQSTLKALADHILGEFPDEIGRFYFSHRSLSVKNSSLGTKRTSKKQISFKKIESHSSSEPIAVIGMACVLPGAKNADEFWENLISEKDVIKEIPSERWDWREQAYGRKGKKTKESNFPKWGGFIDGVDLFDPQFFNISPREAELMDPQHRLFLETVWKAIEDAGYKASSFWGKNVGVFGGIQFSDYQDLLSAMGEAPAQMGTGNSHAMLCNRISYLLNLKGPSESIDTACSSSLVAVHRAVKSIQSGECEHAIAGGVSLILSPGTFMGAVNLGVLSQDGRCKTFDGRANGYVRGEGVGAVLLKPLSQAVSDGDHIYGIIKGSAENHGGRANSLTAPNSDAQCDVIVKAHEDSEVYYGGVTYIETHGTGTELGDPVEIEGLKKAFRILSEKKGGMPDGRKFCGLGSVKTNIGHLEPAAGIAGMIKVLLSFKNGRIPALMHFKEINPYIDLEGSPFHIADKSREWTRDTDVDGNPAPRRAGVSSFGFGGSNSHVVLEEHIDITVKASESCKPRLFVISAKNKERLNSYVECVIEFIERINFEKGNDSISFDDFVYTFQVGREPMDERFAAVVASFSELMDRLKEFTRGEVTSSFAGNIKSGGGFSFLLEGKSGEDFLEGLIRNMELSKMARLWVSGVEFDWDELYDEVPKRISAPTYPFKRERYWVPEINKASAVRTASLHPLIDSNESTLEEQCYKKIFSGNEPFLRETVSGMELPPLIQLEMIRAAGTLAGKMKTLKKIENVRWDFTADMPDTGREITVSFFPAYGDIEYEVSGKDGDNAIIFSRGKITFATVDELNEENRSELNIKEIIARCARDNEVLASEKNNHRINEIYKNDNEALSKIVLSEKEYPYETGYLLRPDLLEGIAQTLNGFLSSKGEFYDPVSVMEVTLTSFEGSTFYIYVVNRSESPEKFLDVKVTGPDGKVFLSMKGLTVKSVHKTIRNLKSEESTTVGFYACEWIRSEPRQGINTHANGDIVLFDHVADVSESMKKMMAGEKGRIISVRQGGGYSSLGNYAYEINPEIFEDYIKLFEELKEKNIFPSAIINLWPFCEKYDIEKLVDSAERCATSGIHSVFHVVKAITQSKIKSLKRFIVAHPLLGETANPYFDAVAGFCKSIKMITPSLSMSLVGISGNEKDANDLANLLFSELNAVDSSDSEIRYISGERYTRKVVPANVKEDAGTTFKENGIYLITGGTGALGMIFAKHLAEKYRARLVLTGRSPLDVEKEKKIAELNSAGAEAIYISSDASSIDGMISLVGTIVEKFGHLNGVMHAAGTAFEKTIDKKNISDLENTLRPKTAGTLALDQATNDVDLDFFALFSSTSSVLGDFGQCDYSAGNRFLDSFTEVRETLREKGIRKGRTICVNWPLWREGGMHFDKKAEAMYLSSSGMSYLETSDGVSAFEKALKSGLTSVIVVPGDRARIEKFLRVSVKVVPEKNSDVDIRTDETKTKINLSVKKDNWSGTVSSGSVEDDIRKIASDILKIDRAQLSDDDNFGDHGFDSITLKELGMAVGEFFGVELSPTVFFAHSSVRSLAGHLKEEFRKEITIFYGKTALKKETPVKTDTVIDEKSSARHSSVRSIRFGKNYDEPIAIIGASGIFPGAKDLNEFWKNLANGKDCITEIPPERWDWREFYGDPAAPGNRANSKWGGFISGVELFDASFFSISPKEAALMDPQQRLFLQTVWKAFEDAGYRISDFSGKKIGVFAGVQFTDYQELLGAQREIQPQRGTGNALSMLANRVSYHYNFRGPSESVETACSSSLVALHRALGSLRSGESEMAVAGGVSLMLSPYTYVAAAKLGILSPDGRCKTFDKSANGYVKGEGIGAVILKPLKKAVEDGDNIYAVIKGSAVAHGGKANSLTAPNSEAQAAMIAGAYESVGITPDSVSYIEAHGTGTELGDPVEIQGLKKAFGKLSEKLIADQIGKNYCGLGSLKTNIGHLEPAAGIAGIIKIILSMRNETLPGVVHFREINPYIELEGTPFYIIEKTMQWKKLKDKNGMEVPRRAGISSFGFGGSYAHIILEESSVRKGKPAEKVKFPYYFTLSAKNKERLNAYALEFIDFLKNNDMAIDPADVAFTLQTGRELMDSRLVIVGGSIDNFVSGLENYIAGKTDAEKNLIMASKTTDSNESAFMDAAKKWLKGENIDWAALYGSARRFRVSLPTYPFAEERHWAPDDMKGGIDRGKHSVGKLHPLLHANISTLSEQKFSSSFTGKDFFMSDHIVSGRMFLPGVASVEIGLVAGEISGEKKVRKLKDLMWISPLAINSSKPSVEVITSVFPSEDGAFFEISHMDGERRVKASEGRIVFGEDENEHGDIVDIDSIKRRCVGEINAEDCYAFYTSAGLEYGPAFRSIRELYFNENESLSLLQIPSSSNTMEFVLHPSLLDGALQSIIGISGLKNMEQGALFLPFSLGEVHLISKMSSVCYAHAVRKKSSSELEKFDVNIYGLDGKLLLEMKDFVARSFKKDDRLKESDISAGKKAEVDDAIMKVFNNVREGKITIDEADLILEGINGQE